MTPPLRIGAFLSAGFIRAMGRTWRFQTIGQHHLDEARKVSPILIFSFWHGRMLPMSYYARGWGIHVLASEHSDGELMGRTIRNLGFGHVRGSSTRGGARGLRGMVAKLRDGYDLGLTVDGPKGPRFVVKPGVVEIAKISGAAVVPVTTSSARRWVFSSWDAFELPKPFTRVGVRFGRAVFVPAAATPGELEEKRLEVEKVLNEITRINDDAFARS